MRWVPWALMLPAGVLASQGPADSLAALPADVLVARVGEYVRRFERSMSAVVLEEHYVQIIKRWMGPPKEPDQGRLAWLDDPSAVRPDVIVKERRQTRSDVLLVQLPDQRWTAFRDTFEVNGTLRRSRDERLRELFLERSDNSRRQLQRINEASAYWNIGRFYRDVNVPTMVLFLLHPGNQSRFAFSAGAIERAGRAACRFVSFAERVRPTVVRSTGGADIPSRGRACLDATGTVWSTRLDLDERYTTRGAIEVVYEPNDRVNVLVPGRMWEWYFLPGPGTTEGPTYVEGMATYSNLRQFTVTTSER